MNDQPNLTTSMFFEEWKKHCLSVYDPRLYGSYAFQQKMLSSFIFRGIPTKEDIRKIVADKSACQHVLIVLPKTKSDHHRKTKELVIRRLNSEFNQHDVSDKDICADISFEDSTGYQFVTNSRWKFLCQMILSRVDMSRRFNVCDLGWPEVSLKETSESDADQDVGQHEVNVQFFFNKAPERIHVEMKIDGTESSRLTHS